MDRLVSRFENGLTWITNNYGYVVAWSLRHKALVLISAMILFLGSVTLIPAGFIGSEFVSMGDRGEVIIKIELPKNATIEQTNQATLRSRS